MIRRLLIANRGEIAIRIARAARECGVVPLGVYSDADEGAAFRDALDASLRIGPGEPGASYLDGAAIISAARRLGADAVHPGYGFLSERADFAADVAAAGLTFVGPPPGVLAATGSKIEAKDAARAAAVEVVPGYDGAEQTGERLRAEAEKLGTPLVIKASAGGGGRGMRVVTDLAAFEEALASARREALASFGDGTMLLERYLARPRHVEFQILADAHGRVVHLGERECSIQRRHQKVLEEAPSTGLDAALRERMGAAAVALARAVGYVSAGTVEFLVDGADFWFLEINPRLQVEHPVTELVYGVDLVHEQLRIAAGAPLRLTQADVRARGWAIQARLNAEDPAQDYAPQAGTLAAFDVAPGPGVRLDAGVRAGSTVPPFYDSLLAKIIVWGEDRAAAVARLRTTLAATHVAGIATNLPLLRAIAADEAFGRGATTTAYLDERASALAGPPDRTADAAWLAAGALLEAGRGWRIGGIGVPVAIACGSAVFRSAADRTAGGWRLCGDLGGEIALARTGPTLRVRRSGASELAGEAVAAGDGAAVTLEGRAYAFAAAPPPDAALGTGHASAGSGAVAAPMPGKIAAIAVAPGDTVRARDLLVVLEAMKMEHRIEAPVTGTVESVRVVPGELVAGGAILVVIGASAHG